MLLTRLAAICGAAAAMVWAAGAMGDMTAARTLQRTAERYADATSFTAADIQALEPLIARAEAAPWCNAYALHAAMTIRVRLVEVAMAAARRAEIDAGLDEARTAAARTLRCTPTDAFAWLVLYRIAVAQQGFSSAVLPLLEKSYAVGRNEAWVELRRNRFALAAYDALPDTLRRTVRDEFADLVRLHFYDEAAAVIEGPGWDHRAALVAALDAVPVRNRYLFAVKVRHDGVDLPLPGIALPDARPWW